ncbi:MAG TPA: class I SAM-dependent methyltransferase [Bacteroidia bacterium]|nr:class I SAM-dependent methyltransferase [Bacteroidia bacterium]
MFKKILLLFRFIKYRTHALNAHGIHSPFIFELFRKTIRSETEAAIKKTLEQLRRRMLSDQRILSATDYGTAGGKSRQRESSVSYIMRHYASGIRKAELLYRLSKYFSPATILELGTSVGIGTTALALGSTTSKVISLEGSAETAEVAVENFYSAEINNVEVITGEFGSTLAHALEKISVVDLVFIDGNHRSVPTLSYFEQCLAKANENSLFIFDDIHWSADMEKAWKEIQLHPSVSITIDLFVVGLVFFRRGIAKQNFILKF